MLLSGSCSCEGLHSSLWRWETLPSLGGSERGGCYKPSFKIWTIFEPAPRVSQVWQKFWSLVSTGRLVTTFLTFVTGLNKTTEWHKKHLSHILLYTFSERNKNLLTRDLLLSFAKAREQYEQEVQHLSLHKCL